MLPSDNHVHSEWSWDAHLGSMESTCARAAELGLPSIAFTEHADLGPQVIPPGATIPDQLQEFVSDGFLLTPQLDLEGYFECLERCRHMFPELRILSGVELGEPHWHVERARDLLRRGRFERVLGSMHSFQFGGGASDFCWGHGEVPAGDGLRTYLEEVIIMIREFDDMQVLAHIDYPVRYWPSDGIPYDVSHFEEEYRVVLRELAESERVLEMNTRVPMDSCIIRWWYEEKGRGISFASDAHDPDSLASGFKQAAWMAQANGFKPGRTADEFWRRA
ncbi:PHP domain-containing protein [Streptomyces sp. NPDC050658]|uniref:PHP domain-containing protein n=1 Tax=unclassified Streptomyces TaxID=2593676 RepID=UPI00344097AE